MQEGDTGDEMYVHLGGCIAQRNIVGQIYDFHRYMGLSENSVPLNPNLFLELFV